MFVIVDFWSVARQCSIGIRNTNPRRFMHRSGRQKKRCHLYWMNFNWKIIWKLSGGYLIFVWCPVSKKKVNAWPCVSMWDISLLHRIHRMKTISERRKQNTGSHIRARRTCREAVVGFWEAKVNVTTMHSRSFNQHCKSFVKDKVMLDKPKLTILRFNILVGHQVYLKPIKLH